MLSSYLRKQIVEAIQRLDRRDTHKQQFDLPVMSRIARCFWGEGAQERIQAAFEAEITMQLPISGIEESSGVFFYVV